MQRHPVKIISIFLFFLLSFSVLTRLSCEINRLKTDNMKIELILLSERQDYSRSFSIFNRLRSRNGFSRESRQDVNRKMLLEAQYESVILNSDYSLFPEYYPDHSILRKIIMKVDKKLNPGFYKMVENRRVRGEKFMEIAYYLELNKNYQRAARYYTVFLTVNRLKKNDYYSIAALHLAFCYLLYGYIENSIYLIKEIIASSHNNLILDSAERLLQFIESGPVVYYNNLLMNKYAVLLEWGLRGFFVLNYRESIRTLSSLLLGGKLHKRREIEKAMYYLGRSYEETGQYDRAILYYRKLLSPETSGIFRNRSVKRLLLLHYIYHAEVREIESLLKKYGAIIGAGIIDEIKKISPIGLKLKERRTWLEGEIKRLESRIEKAQLQGDDHNNRIIVFLKKFERENREQHRIDFQLLKELQEITAVAQKKTVPETERETVERKVIKIYLKNGTELVGKLIKKGDTYFSIKTFGKTMRIGYDEISKWEIVNKN